MTNCPATVFEVGPMTLAFLTQLLTLATAIYAAWRLQRNSTLLKEVHAANGNVAPSHEDPQT